MPAPWTIKHARDSEELLALVADSSPGEVVYTPSSPHKCEIPKQMTLLGTPGHQKFLDTYPSGTIWKCKHCNKHWRAKWDMVYISWHSISKRRVHRLLRKTGVLK